MGVFIVYIIIIVLVSCYLVKDNNDKGGHFR